MRSVIACTLLLGAFVPLVWSRPLEDTSQEDLPSLSGEARFLPATERALEDAVDQPDASSEDQTEDYEEVKRALRSAISNKQETLDSYEAHDGENSTKETEVHNEILSLRVFNELENTSELPINIREDFVTESSSDTSFERDAAERKSTAVDENKSLHSSFEVGTEQYYEVLSESKKSSDSKLVHEPEPEPKLEAYNVNEVFFNKKNEIRSNLVDLEISSHEETYTERVDASELPLAKKSQLEETSNEFSHEVSVNETLVTRHRRHVEHSRRKNILSDHSVDLIVSVESSEIGEVTEKSSTASVGLRYSSLESVERQINFDKASKESVEPKENIGKISDESKEPLQSSVMSQPMKIIANVETPDSLEDTGKLSKESTGSLKVVKHQKNPSKQSQNISNKPVKESIEIQTVTEKISRESAESEELTQINNHESVNPEEITKKPSTESLESDELTLMKKIEYVHPQDVTEKPSMESVETHEHENQLSSESKESIEITVRPSKDSLESFEVTEKYSKESIESLENTTKLSRESFESQESLENTFNDSLESKELRDMTSKESLELLQTTEKYSKEQYSMESVELYLVSNGKLR